MAGFFSNFSGMKDPKTYMGLALLAALQVVFEMMNLGMISIVISLVAGIGVFAYLYSLKCSTEVSKQVVGGSIASVISTVLNLLISFFPLFRILKFIPIVGTLVIGFISYFLGYLITITFKSCS